MCSMRQGLEAGQVVINSGAMMAANTPFGGVKESGFVRNMEDSLDGWTVLKTVKIAILPAKAAKL